MIGRENETKKLLELYRHDQADLVVIYGRRRVGKTFLVDETFHGEYLFMHSGLFLEKGNMSSKEMFLAQLSEFYNSLKIYGCKEEKAPATWYEAFFYLEKLILEKENGSKQVIFLDELPWLDTPSSRFLSAFEGFWNSFSCRRKNLLIIVCGSATSWIVNNISKDTGGFYNRVTNQIHLMPFHLKECREICLRKGLDYENETIAKAYMVFGGVPYYWRLLLPSNSLDQEIDRLCFKVNGTLRYELQNLFSSLFSAGGCHGQIVAALAKKTMGLTRQELIKLGLPGGGKSLTKALEELEQCGFIRKFNRPGHTNDGYYQIKDPFVRFANDFLGGEKTSSWTSYIDTPSYYSWQGNAFELLCLNHVEEIKNALGVLGVESNEYSFRSKKHSPGAQIDLVIDRKDLVSNLCEMKYTSHPFVIDKAYASVLENKKAAFRTETKTKNAVRLTLVASKGLAKNSYSDIVRNIVTLDDLFR